MAKRVETTEEQAEKKAYIERKKKLVKFEETNYSKIVFLKGTKEYWITGGHSAIILANKIAPEVKLRVALRRDTDFDVKFKEGVINLRNLGAYKNKLENSKYLKRDEESEFYFSYKLDEEISEAEFDLLVRSKEIRRQKLQNMIEKSVPIPKLNMRLSDVFKLTYKLYRKESDTFARETIAKKILEDVRIAHKTMIMIFRGQVEPKAGLNKINSYLELALCDLTQIIELEIWSLENATTLATLIIETKLVIEAEVKRILGIERRDAKSVKKVKAIIEGKD